MDAREKFEEHEKCVRVARSVAVSNCGFLSALQTSQVHPEFDRRTAKSISKFFCNRATTRICVKKPFIVIERKIFTTHKKVNKRPHWLVKNTTHFILWFVWELLIQLTDNREWKAQSLRGKWRKSKPNELINEFPVDQDLKGQCSWAVLCWFLPYF